MNKQLQIVLYLVFLTIGFNYALEEDSEFTSQDDRHQNRPRFFGSIFSRPKPEAEKQHGIGLKDHLGNVMKGGSIGFQAEFKPLAPIHGLIDHAKKIIPFPGMSKPGLGLKPVMNEGPYNKPPQSWWEEEKEGKGGLPQDYDYKYPNEDPKLEEAVNPEPHDWEPQNPKEVKTNGPRWEDIGEDNDYGKDHTTVPIEEIIQPRHRPRSKRRVESKVYHVPIDFITNGKPYLVKIGTNDGI